MKIPLKGVSRNATFLNQIGEGGANVGKLRTFQNRNWWITAIVVAEYIRTNEASILWNPIFLLRATNGTLKKAPTNLPSYLANTSI